MKPVARVQAGRRGFALVLVMVIIAVLGVLAGTFAYSMKVETKLARNASEDSEMEWLGRSGVEFARYVLGQSMSSTPYTALNQLWAGGPGGPTETNSALAGISLRNNHLGSGMFSVRIRDLERKFNINKADPELLQHALTVIGVDAADSSIIVDSIMDWRDPDDEPRPSGTESDYYLNLDPPYFAKNGPIDDLAELLLVRGVTPAIYWGPNAAEHLSQLFQPNKAAGATAGAMPAYPVGLVDLFTPLSNGMVNLNTASIYVLQMLPGVDLNVANGIVRTRAGPDGVEGTEDDMPFQNPGMLAMVPGVNPQFIPLYARFCTVSSSTFEVTVDAQIGQYRKRFTAVLGRVRPNDVRILTFSWR